MFAGILHGGSYPIAAPEIIFLNVTGDSPVHGNRRYLVVLPLFHKRPPLLHSMPHGVQGIHVSIIPAQFKIPGGIKNHFFRDDSEPIRHIQQADFPILLPFLRSIAGFARRPVVHFPAIIYDIPLCLGKLIHHALGFFHIVLLDGF